MRKHYSLHILIIFLLLNSCTTESKIETDWETLGINGKVERLLEVHFISTQSFGELIPVKVLNDLNSRNKSEIIFNKNGFITKITNYKMNGDIYDVVNFNYNINNLLEETHSIDSDGETVYKEHFEYNEALQLLNNKRFNKQGDLEYEVILTYNGDGLLTETNGYGEDGNRIFRRVYEYDDNELIKVESIYLSDGYNYTYKYKYDDVSNLKSLEFYDENGKLDFSERYEYKRDDRGNWINKTIYNQDTEPELVFREIIYFDGKVSGDVDSAESIAEEQLKDQVENKIIEEIRTIVSLSQTYFYTPGMLGGGGRSFEKFNFSKIDFRTLTICNDFRKANSKYANFEVNNRRQDSYTIIATPLNWSNKIFEVVVESNGHELSIRN